MKKSLLLLLAAPSLLLASCNITFGRHSSSSDAPAESSSEKEDESSEGEKESSSKEEEDSSSTDISTTIDESSVMPSSSEQESGEESSSAPLEGKLTLFNPYSRFYLEGVSASAPILATYHHRDHGNVPYVSVRQYFEIMGSLRSWVSASVDVDGDFYTVNIQNTPFFTYDASMNTFSISGKYIHYYMTVAYMRNNDCYFDLAQWGNNLAGIVKPSESSHYLENPTDHMIDFGDYDIEVVTGEDDFYMPFQALALASTDDTWATLAYDGIDYWCHIILQEASTAPSSNGNFRYADAGLSAGKTTFHKVANKGLEVYRFESDNYTIRAGLADQDTKSAIVLYNNGTGERIFYNSVGADISGDVRFQETFTWTYNEDANNLYLSGSRSTAGSWDFVVHLNESFYGQETRTAEYANYDYNCLRLYFGEFYGMDNGGVPSINTFIASYKTSLLSTNAADYNAAMANFLLSGIDDCHTSLDGGCFFGDEGCNIRALTSEYRGPRYTSLLTILQQYNQNRSNASLTEGLDYYNETAFIRFDSFSANPYFTGMSFQVSDYYEYAPNTYVEEATYDTNGLALASMHDIKTNHPEIKRVVFDVTCNGGGMVATLPILESIMTDDPIFTTHNAINGAVAEYHYDVDLNSNGVYGEATDTYAGEYEFYVLTSNFSFSCANAFPTVVHNAGMAKVIGQTSGGGACSVAGMRTASGFSYKTSSSFAILLHDTVKDEWIDNDAGVTPDHEIAPAKFYDEAYIDTFCNEIEAL